MTLVQTCYRYRPGLAARRPCPSRCMPFAPAVRSSGLLLINSSLVKVDQEGDRDDITVVRIPANDLAQEAGGNKAANIVMLGAYVELTKVVKFSTIKQTVEEAFANKRRFLPVNLKALEGGRRAAAGLIKGRSA